MADDVSEKSDDDEGQTPLKDYWSSLQSNISKASKRVKESSHKAAKTASEWGEQQSEKIKSEMERRRAEKEKRHTENMKQVRESLSKDILPVTEHIPPQVTIPVEEYESLYAQIAELQNECQQQMKLVGEMQALTEELVQREEKDTSTELVVLDQKTPQLLSEREREGLVSEMKNSMDQILLSLGGSVVWAAMLIGIDLYLNTQGYTYQGYSLNVIVWPVGTALWSLFLLGRLAKARTFLTMGWSMRIKTALGIGLATELAMLLMNEEMQAITNVWGWSATVALTAFLLSGFFRGIWGTFARLFGLNSGKNLPEIVDITEQ